MGGITAKNFGSIEIPLFRKEEQKRIVSRIEEIFSSLDNAVEMLNKTKGSVLLEWDSTMIYILPVMNSAEILI